MLAENPEVGAGYDLRRGINLTYQGKALPFGGKVVALIFRSVRKTRTCNISFYLYFISYDRFADPDLVILPGSGSGFK